MMHISSLQATSYRLNENCFCVLRLSLKFTIILIRIGQKLSFLVLYSNNLHMPLFCVDELLSKVNVSLQMRYDDLAVRALNWQSIILGRSGYCS